MIYKNIFKKNGQSLVEVVVAMAIFSFLAVSLITLILGSLSLSVESGRITKASFLAQEGLEAVISIKTRAWNELVYNKSAVTSLPGEWQFLGEDSSEQIGKFSRTINFFDVYRNSQNDIVGAGEPGAFFDIGSKKVEAVVSWETGRGGTNSLQKRILLTSWNQNEWIQESWSGGFGQEVYSISDQYDFDDGNIESNFNDMLSLREIATSSSALEGFLVSSAFDMGEYGAPSIIYVDKFIPASCEACEVLVQIQTAKDEGGVPGAWSLFWSGPNGEDGDESDFYTATSTGALVHKDHNDDQWLRYKVTLFGDGVNTPLLREFKLEYNK